MFFIDRKDSIRQYEVMDCSEIGIMKLIKIAIVLILCFSTRIIEKRLKTIEDQNGKIIEVLEEIRDKE